MDGVLHGRRGPQPQPSLHGDAQQNNFLTTATDAVLLDEAPYFGHPEIGLALVNYFTPVPDEVFDAYRDVTPIDPGFRYRRELWRLFAYLAVITVDGASDFGYRCPALSMGGHPDLPAICSLVGLAALRIQEWSAVPGACSGLASRPTWCAGDGWDNCSLRKACVK